MDRPSKRTQGHLRLASPTSAASALRDADADAARAELVGRGVEASEVQDFPWGRFVFFRDPDGNQWSVQQLPPR